MLITLFFTLDPLLQPGGTLRDSGWQLLLSFVLFLTILIHELGHCFMARRTGGFVDRITLWPLGGLARIGEGSGWGRTGTIINRIKVALAGPATHVPLALLVVGLILLFGPPWKWTMLVPFAESPVSPFEWFLVWTLRIQVILLAFNLLLPAYPLDGGQILANTLLLRHPPLRVARSVVAISFVVGFVMILWGLHQNLLFLALIGFWILQDAWLLRRLTQWGELEQHPLFSLPGGAWYEGGDYGKPERRPGFLARWKARRQERKRREDEARASRLAEEVDRILEKVSREGINTLTPAERKILDQASRETRRRD